ncbi:MAG: DUF493 domain-containing protein [Pseudomonadota bacterium]
MDAKQSLLEFPCQFPIKVMGLAGRDFDDFVVEIVRKHVPKLAEDAVARRLSSQGKYTSVTVTFEAKSQAQLDALYTELSGHERIMMVL